MSSSGNHTPFKPDYPLDTDLLRKTLTGKGYVQEAVAETMNLDAPEGPLARKSDVYAVFRRTEKPSVYHTLVRLFILGREVSLDAVLEAMEPVSLEDLVSAGLLEKSPGGMRAQAALLPYEGSLFLCDFLPQITGSLAADDFVLGIGPSTVSLANMTVRHKVSRVLDLGAGAGFQSIKAASHSEKVVATDINERALNFGAMNARISGCPNIEFRKGSLFEPVEGEAFDLIVCNPPFVISPKGNYQYRDSFMEGDSLCSQVVRGAPSLLNEGGFCSVLVNWHHRDETDWAERPLSWLSESKCDILLICSETEDPIAYASAWLSRDAAVSPELFPETLDRWLAYYDRLGVGKISFGAVILRRRSGGGNWVLSDRAPEYRARGPCSEQILRIFAAQDVLASGDDLLNRRLVLSRDHELTQNLKSEDGIWKVSSAQIRQSGGFPFTGNVDKLMVTMLAGCTGERTLSELIGDLAKGLNMEPSQITRPCLEVMGKLMQKGFLSVMNH